MKQNEIINNHEQGFKVRLELYPELFDLDFWKKQESYKLIKTYIPCQNFSILEVGCLTGHHLLLLEQEGYKDLAGIDFLSEAIKWGKSRTKNIQFICNDYMKTTLVFKQDYIILFDVLEYIEKSKVSLFLDKIKTDLHKQGEILVLVSKGNNYPDKCHINKYPTLLSLKKELRTNFEIMDSYEVEDGKKLFIRCGIEYE